MRGKLAMLSLANPLVDILGPGAYWLILIPIYLCFKPSILNVKKVYNLPMILMLPISDGSGKNTGLFSD